MTRQSDPHQFTRTALADGHPAEDIAAALAATGWSAGEIRDALGAWDIRPGLPPVPRRERTALTAQRWICPYYQVKFDMSWVLTSNDRRRLPEPLLSRCPPIRLRHLTLTELLAFVRREGVRRNLSGTSIEAICEILSHPSLQCHHPSLRVVARMLQRAADLEQGPTLH